MERWRREKLAYDVQVGIVGYGYVGRAVERFFQLRYATSAYDEPLAHGTRDEINAADLAVVCVPTPARLDGACDTSIIESVIGWLHTPLVLIKSTIPPGTTRQLQERTDSALVFSPEYIGESRYYTPPEYPHPNDMEKHRFFIFGGEKRWTSRCIDLIAPIVGPHAFFYQTDSTTAEVIKYWENTWGAMKVTFANEMYDICKAFGVDYWEAREGWALDSRTEKMHSAVFVQERGVRGKCLPKDVFALYRAAQKRGHNSALLRYIIEKNQELQKEDGK